MNTGSRTLHQPLPVRRWPALHDIFAQIPCYPALLRRYDPRPFIGPSPRNRGSSWPCTGIRYLHLVPCPENGSPACHRPRDSCIVLLQVDPDYSWR